MPGWKNKKDSGKNPAASQNGSAGAADQGESVVRHRRANEMLASVVKTTEQGSVVALLRSNEAFALPGGQAWVGIGLRVQEIGGLSAKQSRDEAKGSIIELINSTMIEVVVTAELLDRDVLGIIPTQGTLQRMKEYSLLTDTNAEAYYWVVYRIGDDGLLVVDPVSATNFAEVEAVAAGNLSIATVLPGVWAWANGDPAPAESEIEQDRDETVVAMVVPAQGQGDQQDPFAAASSQHDGQGDGGAPAGRVTLDKQEQPGQPESTSSAAAEGDTGIDYELMDEDGASMGESDEQSDEPVASDDGYDPDSDDGGEAAYAAANADRVVPEQEVRDNIARRFLNDELGLYVSLDEFDAAFRTQAPVIEIAIADDPADWMGSQIAQLSREANAELRQLHSNNLAALRQDYLNMLNIHVQKVTTAVSEKNAASIYAALTSEADKEFHDAKANAASDASRQRGELSAALDAEANLRGEQAAAHARAVYKDQRRPGVELAISQVGVRIEQQIEERREYNRARVLQLRRNDAATRMDIGTSSTLTYLIEQAKALRDAEMALLESWNARLSSYVDEHRKEDVARAAALADQLERSNTLEVLKGEHTAALEDLRTSQEARVRELNALNISQREDAATTLREARASAEHEVTLRDAELVAARKLNTVLTDQMASLEGTTEARWADRVNTLTVDRDANIAALKNSNELQKRANYILIALLILLAVLALLAGVAAGWSLHGSGTHSAVGAGNHMAALLRGGPSS